MKGTKMWLIAIGNVVLLLAFVWLTLALRQARGIIAETLDLHTRVMQRLHADLQDVAARTAPRYADAVIQLPIGPTAPAVVITAAEAEAARLVVQETHDAAVREALANPLPGAVALGDVTATGNVPGSPLMNSAGLLDPDFAPFFTRSAPRNEWLSR